MKRRSFLGHTAIAATALSYSRILGANERVSLGFVGLGNRGDQVLTAFLEWPESQIDALCDLRQDYMDYAKGRTEGRGTRNYYSDYRKLLENQDLDATVICTPDHWHALMTIHTCMAGKDVYVEKPLSLTVVEGRRMVQAVRKYDRVSQVGTHRRSLTWCKEATKRVREGGIGQVTVTDGYQIANEWPVGIGKPANTPPPPDADYDLWVGPAPKADHNVNRTFYKFRWFPTHSGGQVTNIGVHHMDVIQWGLGIDRPRRVTGFGGNFAIDDNREIPDTVRLLWEYDGGVIAGWSQYDANGSRPARGNEMEFRGTLGTMFVYNDGFTIEPDKLSIHGRYARSPLPDKRAEDRTLRQETETRIEPHESRGNSRGTEHHARNFLDCVKTRERCTADIEIGHRSTSTPLIGNIALKVGKTLEWDGDRERFTNDREANELLHYEYRKPWVLPKV